MLYEPVFRILSTNFVVLLFFLYWFYFSLLNYELLLIDHMLLQCPIPVNWVWMWRFYQWFFFCQIKLIHSDKYLTPWLSHLKFAFSPQNFTNSKIYIHIWYILFVSDLVINDNFQKYYFVVLLWIEVACIFCDV